MATAEHIVQFILEKNDDILSLVYIAVEKYLFLRFFLNRSSYFPTLSSVYFFFGKFLNKDIPCTITVQGI